MQPTNIAGVSFNLGEMPQALGSLRGPVDKFQALSLPWQVAAIGVMGVLGWAGYRRGVGVQRRCGDACHTVLPTLGWSLLAWPVGTGYLVGRLAASE